MKSWGGEVKFEVENRDCAVKVKQKLEAISITKSDVSYRLSNSNTLKLDCEAKCKLEVRGKLKTSVI